MKERRIGRKFVIFIICFLFSCLLSVSASAPHSDMVCIKGGDYRIGRDNNVEILIDICKKYLTFDKSDYDEKCESPCEMYSYFSAPERAVRVSTYYIDKYEVTYGEYLDCVGDNKCRDLGYDEEYQGNWPVVSHYYSDAKDYCEWAGKRLPTEAEWEIAARGKTDNIFPWGDIYTGTEANLCDVNCGREDRMPQVNDGYTGFAPVGSFPKDVSPFGVMDMGGNVSEWCSDIYKKRYSTKMKINPKGPIIGNPFLKEYVIRGGSYESFPPEATVSIRNGAPPFIANWVGFRCVMPAK